MAQSDSRTTVPRGTGRGALIIVGVLALLGLAYAIARVDILRARIVTLQMDLQGQQDNHQSLQGRFDALSADAQNNDAQIAQLQQSLRSLNDNFGELHQRAALAQREIARSEALYLLRLAQDQLQLAHDVGGATDTLSAAAAILGANSDAGISAVHRQVLAYLEQLRAIPQADVAMAAQQLGTAEQQIQTLPLAGILADRRVPNDALPEEGLPRAWAVLRRALLALFSVRKIGGDSVAVLDTEEQMLRRRHLQLLIANARLAVASRDQAVYVEAVRAADDWLAHNFDTESPAVAQLQAQLKQLAKYELAPATPDLRTAIQALQDKLSGSSAATS